MINFRILFVVALLTLACAGIGLLRLDIDTDVVRSLPAGDRVIADGLDIFEHHPIHDQIAVDVMLSADDPDTLVQYGTFLEEKMRESGLFAQVGTDAVGDLIPEIALYTAEHLPFLLSAEELDSITPRLQQTAVKKRLQELYTQLSSMEGIGQEKFMGLDPLGLKDLILAKMAPLAPTLNSRFYQGKLLSADGRHLLVTARPLVAGTDTASARRISGLIADTAAQLNTKAGEQGNAVTLTPVGAFRAALDNEQIIRHDVQLALVLATVGIGLLLLLSFSRPLIGLLSLVPALAGTAAALFTYSLFHSGISIMVLGFGGAIISITVDHGIAYMLFLDRSTATKGKDASHEVRAIGIMAVVTTIGAFLILGFSGFPIFTELGQFTALGILFSFLFVHLIFPRIFPTMPAGRRRSLPLRRLVDALYSTGWPGAAVAALAAVVLLFFATPVFNVTLDSMNTVSKETLQADELFSRVWGNIGNRVFLMTSSAGISELQKNNDRILAGVEDDIADRVLENGFVPSMIFPGPEKSAANLAAWQNFWSSEQRRGVRETLQTSGAELGFSRQAFAGFFKMLDPGYNDRPPEIADKYFSLLGISENSKGSGLIQFITLIPGDKYQAESFFSRYSDVGKIFDGPYFAKRLADILFSTFSRMLMIIGGGLALLLFFFYLSLPLTLLTLTPVIFAYICTLGTLNLIGHPLDIPALMLSIIILGMGIDYSIFCVRAHQRYRDSSHPSFTLVRCSVFLAGASTLIGFGVLCFAQHSLLRSIGVTSFTGIGYSLLGTFLLLPPLLNRYFADPDRNRNGTEQAKDLNRRIRDRFRLLETYPRMFARFKLKYDPMFAELPGMLAHRGKKEVAVIADIGCGYGVPACWCLEYFPDARLYGIDPDPERVRVASLAAGNRGDIRQGWAPEIPSLPQPVEVFLLLDMLHYLDDDTAIELLANSFQSLAVGGVLVARFVIKPEAKPSWYWLFEDKRAQLSGFETHYRTAGEMAGLMAGAGFTVAVNEVTRANPELIWLVGRVDTGAVSGK